MRIFCLNELSLWWKYFVLNTYISLIHNILFTDQTFPREKTLNPLIFNTFSMERKCSRKFCDIVCDIDFLKSLFESARVWHVEWSAPLFCEAPSVYFICTKMFSVFPAAMLCNAQVQTNFRWWIKNSLIFGIWIAGVQGCFF